jgi:hypothetical protein
MVCIAGVFDGGSGTCLCAHVLGNLSKRLIPITLPALPIDYNALSHAVTTAVEQI